MDRFRQKMIPQKGSVWSVGWMLWSVVALLCACMSFTSGQNLVARPAPVRLCGRGALTGWGSYLDGVRGRPDQRRVDRLCYYHYDHYNFGFCNDVEKCTCGRDNANHPVGGSAALEYCRFLVQDTDDSWMYPYRGRHPNPPPGWANLQDKGLQEQMNYQCGSFHYCLAFLPRIPTDTNNDQFSSQLFRFSAYDGTFISDHIARSRRGESIRSDLTNRLRFSEHVAAQEGISFCIAGRHFKRSPLTGMNSMRGFVPLAERSFDIGNHIHPEDPTKMNRFVLDNSHKTFFANLAPGGYENRGTHTAEQIEWNHPNAANRRQQPEWAPIGQHEYENVFAGFIRLDVSNVAGDRNPNQDLPLAEGFENRPAHPFYQPGPNCRNPYKVQVTTIEAVGKPIHNYLHIKVYAEDVGNPTGEKCPTGKMKLLMLEVRDEHGYPVGQFTDEIPCDMDDATVNADIRCPAGLECRRWTGTKENQMPCMFSHPKSNVHPSILLVSAPDLLNTGGAGGNPGAGGAAGQGQAGVAGGQGQAGGAAGDFCNDRNPPPDNNDYFTEVHATWRFAQMNNGWVKELHFATMIVEDETPIQYYTSRKVGWVGPATPSDRFCAAFKNNARTGPCALPCTPDINRGQTDCCVERCSCNPIYVGNELQVQCGSYACGEVNCKQKLYGYPDPHNYWDYNNACWFWHPFWNGWSRVGIHELTLINRCVNEQDNTNRPYGYSAKYTALKPTFKTMGGWDTFQDRYIPGEHVNCHVDLTKGDIYDFEPGQNDKVTIRPGLKNFLKKEYTLEHAPRYPLKGRTRYGISPANPVPRPYVYIHGFHWERVWCDRNAEFVGLDRAGELLYELPDWHSPGLSRTNSPDPLQQLIKFQYFGWSPQSAAKKMFRSAHQDPVVLRTEFPDYPQTEYFGSQHLIHPTVTDSEPDGPLQGEHILDQKFSLEQMANSSRCPCPFIPTTPPPELQTKTDTELDGRRVHVINMLFAWMVLIPLAFFVARFYKETFSRVFFMQEFWWYTIHVLSLLTAVLFMFGGIYGMKLKRDGSYKLVLTNATAVHIYSAYVLIGIYILHLCLGAFRLYKPEWRMIQIALHWGIGWVEYALAIVVSLSSTAIPSGMMNCYAFGIYCGFILFQIVMTLGMELHMRLVVDRQLELDPPREYLPPPMMRVFHRDAPYSKCRMYALVFFAIGCCTFYGVMHLFLSLKDGEVGCFQPVAVTEKPVSQTII